MKQITQIFLEGEIPTLILQPTSITSHSNTLL